MQDKYNDYNAFDRLIHWTETSHAKRLGQRSKQIMGVGTSVTGLALIGNGIWTHDVEGIVFGVASSITGGFLIFHGAIQLEQIPPEN